MAVPALPRAALPEAGGQLIPLDVPHAWAALRASPIKPASTELLADEVVAQQSSDVITRSSTLTAACAAP